MGIAAQLFSSCCSGGSAAASKSRKGGKVDSAGAWEDCPAFDLEEPASQPVSITLSATSQSRAVKPTSDEPEVTDPDFYRTQTPPQPQQQPHPEHPQAPHQLPQGPLAEAGQSFPSPRFPAPRASLPSALSTASSAPPPLTTAISISTPIQDSSAPDAHSEPDSPCATLSPSSGPLPHPERHNLQHRVALRLLERRGGGGFNGTDPPPPLPPLPPLPPGAAAGSNRSSPSTPTGSASGGGTATSPSGAAPSAASASFPTPFSGSEVSSSTASSRPSYRLRPLAAVGGGTSVGALLSPSCRSSGEFGHTGPTPGTAAVAGTGGLHAAVAEDERRCMQEAEEEAALAEEQQDAAAAVRTSLRAGAAAAAAAGGGGGSRTASTGSAVRQAWAWRDGGSGTDGLRMRGSDCGGLLEGGSVRSSMTARTVLVQPAAGTAAAAAAAAASAQGLRASGRLSGLAAAAAGAPSDWSATGGRVEMSQEEKQWLVSQPGGIAGLASVLALGEGGEGCVELVRVELPGGRTVHLARKATRTRLPAEAQQGPGGAVLGRRPHSVSYRFPFECFDREVRALKAVRECGFVVRFQAAAYDHEAGQGFILMEAAQYGTLEDLHAALCRSQLHGAQRQHTPLLRRAFLRLSHSVKTSAPPSLAPGASPTTPTGTFAASAAVAAGNPASGTIRRHTTTTLLNQAAAAAAASDRPSLPRPPGSGIGSCGGAAAEAAAEAEAGGWADRVSCCSSSSAAGQVEPAAVQPAAAGGAGAGAGAGLSGGADGAGAGGGGGGGVGALGSALMSTRALRYYGACMLQALVALHEAGYVYRDLKLSNLLLCEGGRLRLTDFGAADAALPDRPGQFGGVAGTRAYLAPEVLPWLEAEQQQQQQQPGGGGGKRPSGSSGSSASGGTPEPYSVTVDSWGWGLVMVELATGWSLKELTQRVIQRVCDRKRSQPPDLPPDCGLPPALRQLLLDHVLIADPRQRWSAARIRSHRFFEGLDWGTLAEAEGPHAHLFTRGRETAVDADPGAVAEVMRGAEAEAGASAASRGVSRVNSLSREAEATGPGGGSLLRGRPSLSALNIVGSGALSPSGVGPGQGLGVGGSGASVHRLSSPGVRASSSGGLFIAPVVVGMAPPGGGAQVSGGSASGGPRRTTALGIVTQSRLALVP